MMGNRLGRFANWSAGHQARVLGRAGVGADKFAGFGKGRQQRVLDRALDHVTPSTGGAGGPGQQPNLDITAPLTPDVLNQEMNSAVRAKFGGAERQYGQARQDSLQQDTNISKWYQDYLDTLGKAQQSSKDFYGAMAGADVPVPGAGDDQASQAAANRAMLSNSMNSVLKGQGASANALYGDQGANSKLAAIGWHQAETKNRKEIGNQLADLQTQKGDYRNQLYDTARESERKWALEQSTFGLNQDQAYLSAGVDPRTGKPLPPTDGTDVFGSGPFAGLTHDAVRGMSSHDLNVMRNAGKTGHVDNYIQSGAFMGHTQGELHSMSPKQIQGLVDTWNSQHNGKTGGLTDTAVRGNTNNWNKALRNARVYVSHQGGKDPQFDYLQTSLVDGNHIPDDIASAVTYWAQHGAHLTPGLLKAMQKLGIHPERDSRYHGIG